AQELGLDPGSELNLLEARILRNDTDLLLPVAPPQPAAAAPLSVPRELPAGTADFTGRDDELAELDAVLSRDAGLGSSAVVISALDGMAGVGKTALAVHWAHRIKDRFPDGQLFVDLRGHARDTPSDPLRVLARFLRALGIPPERVPLDPDEAAALYRTVLAERRALVVLDNARGPEQVRPLLPGTSSCVTVITSRNQLGGLVARDGARQLTVGVLTDESAWQLVVRIIGEQRVAAEPLAVTELLRLCAHLPLALRIAAAKLANTPGERIADHVRRLRTGNRLDLLQVADDPDAVVRSAFTLSYTSLADEPRRLFRCLGVLPGAGFGAATVAALIGRPVAETVALLGVLAAGHLVEVDGDRYRCHDLLRLYARERLTAEEDADRRDEIMARLHDFYLRSVTAAADLLYPQMLRLPADDPVTDAAPAVFADHDDGLAWLDTELGNLLTVITHNAGNGERRVAWRLADLLRGYFWLRRCTADWLSASDDARRAAELDGDRMAQVSAWLSSAGAHWTISHLSAAVDHYQHALALAGEVGWIESEAAALGNLASVYLERGEMDRAELAYTEALALNTKHGRQSGRAIDLSNLGNLYWELGSLRRAEEHFAEALAIYDTEDAPVPKANALLNLGSVQHDMGTLATALETLRAASALCRKLGDGADEATALELIARVDLDSERFGDALAAGQAALTRAREIGVRRIEAAALHTLGLVHQRIGQADDAIEHHEQALAIGRAIDDRRAVTEALTGLAAAIDNPARALAHADEALHTSELAGYRLLHSRALTVRAQVRVRSGQLPTARDDAQAALDIQLDAGDQLWAARSAELLADAYDELGDTAAADRARDTAHTMRQRIGASVRGRSADRSR
ncbi:MAG TPA: tetratricopeptide repeat protein, partial [Pseudonocardiaceae bacterium]